MKSSFTSLAAIMAVSNACLTTGVDYVGNDIDNVMAPSAKECQAECQALPDCKYFSWNRVQRKCWRKTSNEGRRRAPLFTSGPAYCEKRCEGSVEYTFTFEGNWTPEQYPLNIPPNPHFAPVVVSSHNDMYMLFNEGSMATDGLEVASELGIPDVLTEEFMDSPNVMDFGVTDFDVTTGVITVMTKIFVDADHPLISASAMVAPSSDFFTGVHDIDMCDRSTGEWKTLVEMPAKVYDAGTDNGDCFECANDNANPQMPVKQIECGMGNFCGNGDLSLGKFSISRPTCKGSMEYTFTFKGNWTPEQYPLNIPPNPHFAPVVVASHNDMYMLFKDGSMASTGLEVASELGIPDVLTEEFMDSEDVMHFGVTDFDVTTGVITVSTKIIVDADHPLISASAMVAPSSDFFTGIHDIDMCDESTGEWKSLVEMDAKVYDAGTDNGDCFECVNDNANPQMPVTQIECGMGNFCTSGELALGKFSIATMNMDNSENMADSMPAMNESENMDDAMPSNVDVQSVKTMKCNFLMSESGCNNIGAIFGCSWTGSECVAKPEEMPAPAGAGTGAGSA